MTSKLFKVNNKNTKKHIMTPQRREVSFLSSPPGVFPNKKLPQTGIIIYYQAKHCIIIGKLLKITIHFGIASVSKNMGPN